LVGGCGYHNLSPPSVTLPCPEAGACIPTTSEKGSSSEEASAAHAWSLLSKTAHTTSLPVVGDRLRVGWEGYHESRRCSRDTYPVSYVTSRGPGLPCSSSGGKRNETAGNSLCNSRRAGWTYSRIGRAPHVTTCSFSKSLATNRREQECGRGFYRRQRCPSMCEAWHDERDAGDGRDRGTLACSWEVEAQHVLRLGFAGSKAASKPPLSLGRALFRSKDGCVPRTQMRQSRPDTTEKAHREGCRGPGESLAERDASDRHAACLRVGRL